LARTLRRSATLFGAAALVVSAAACSTGAVTPSPSTSVAGASGPAAPSLAAPSPVVASSAAVASASIAPSLAPDVTFVSDAYRYQAVIPGDLTAGAMTAATEIWDGDGQIDSTGPRTDHAYLADQRLVFSYGAATDLDLDAFAAASQAQKAAWHGCPAKPESSTSVTFGGAPAILASFACGGLHILSVYAVRDGFGLVVNLMNPPGHEADDVAVLERLLAGWSWSS
jgi:hypothetical protein